jgi:hypothetical protein
VVLKSNDCFWRRGAVEHPVRANAITHPVTSEPVGVFMVGAPAGWSEQEEGHGCKSLQAWREAGAGYRVLVLGCSVVGWRRRGWVGRV